MAEAAEHSGLGGRVVGFELKVDPNNPQNDDPPGGRSDTLILYVSQGSGPSGGKAREVIRNALRRKNLSKCLHKFFGRGTILTNYNLPRIDATENLPGAGRMYPDKVPKTGRATVNIDKGNFNGMAADDPFLIDTYLHEVANALAVQRFTNVPESLRGWRAHMGALGSYPADSQKNHPWDPDIGQQFEECLHEE
jgi:hypothetical protein